MQVVGAGAGAGASDQGCWGKLGGTGVDCPICREYLFSTASRMSFMNNGSIAVSYCIEI